MKAVVQPRNSDTRNGVRTYEWGNSGIKCISVTSARMLLGRPHNLATWRENAIVDRAMFEPLEWAEQAGKGEQYLRQWLLDGANAELTDRKTAAELGTAVHQAIEMDLDPLQCTPDVAPFIRQFRTMRDEVGLTLLMQERQVWNLSAGYAGTLDAIGVTERSGFPLVIDWKSSKEMYLDYVMQVHAYLAAEFVGNDGIVDEEATHLLHACKRGALAQLRPDGWAWHEFAFDPTVLRAWLAALQFANHVYYHPEPEWLVELKGKA